MYATNFNNIFIVIEDLNKIIRTSYYIYVTNESIIDQAALKNKIESWNQLPSAEGKFFCRPYSFGNNEPFIFCYRSKWQSHLLQRYGVIVLLDATYKSAKYSLPVDNILVKPNVDYTVEASNVFKQSTLFRLSRI